ncbi:histidine--tRNA ligase [Corynebacterium uropygiale]|uniref:Histidine--tRNA ligase n=1 Tax=Corynebacterium uropygiale TaxID=1775911 RepID=A0A9X1QT37_9CORY|nr:histidine--tRNA ligase [Corynebacterium uropygiale]
MSEKKKFASLSAPKGVPDYVPPVSPRFLAVRDAFIRQAHLAGFQHIELPIFEDTNLFARGVGESTDVVSKEMYTFADRGDRSVTLRPEGTAGVVRAVIEHNLDRGQLPVKLNYAGPFFRYERPQAGRYRQLQQVGVEAIGVDDPALDAEIIALADRCYRSVGLSGYRLELTSLGDRNCRPAYREKLQEFLFALPLDEETRHRASINPLRVLDDKRPEVQEMTADAPLMLDYLNDECREHFETVTGLLDDMGVAYTINPRMVRGLDYYTKTCFEFVHDGLGAQSGIGGGGRYDGLMQQLGGQDLSGIGFGLGVDRTLLALDAEGVELPGTERRVDVYGVALGAEAKKRMAVVIHQLRGAGVAADMSYGDRGLKGAMKGADRAAARYALVLGENELAEGTIAVKDLAQHEQVSVPLTDVVEHLQKALQNAL